MLRLSSVMPQRRVLSPFITVYINNIDIDPKNIIAKFSGLTTMGSFRLSEFGDIFSDNCDEIDQYKNNIRFFFNWYKLEKEIRPSVLRSGSQYFVQS